jgi:enoyl-[acyl-carrier protein] reductase I
MEPRRRAPEVAYGSKRPGNGAPPAEYRRPVTVAGLRHSAGREIVTVNLPAKIRRRHSMTLFSLQGKRGLVVGIANESSIAYGCAKAFRTMGADLAVTYLNEKAEPHVRPLAESLGADIVMPCDLRVGGELEAVFDTLRQRWGKLDFLLHSVAFAPREDLHARVVDCSREGFSLAMDISCHSFVRMAKLAEPLMSEGGCLMTVTFFGAEKVVEHYNMMGPVKAALESSVRYMAAELGAGGIRVHALSPGAMATRAASGIDRFDELLARTAERAPTHHLVTVEDIGPCAAFLASDAAKQLTGLTVYIDGGYHIVG